MTKAHGLDRAHEANQMRDRARGELVPRFAATKTLFGALALLGGLLTPSFASAEPAACLSPNPSAWPSPSKPYFMIAVDSSFRMKNNAGTPSSCSGYGGDLLAHARCAVRNTALSFGGQVSIGLATGARVMSNCAAGCFTNCTFTDFPGNPLGETGCGPEPNPADPVSASRQGANLIVPLAPDDYWNSPQTPTNLSTILGWSDNNCTGSTELFGDLAAKNPMGGMLYDMYRYFTVGWTNPASNVVTPTPLGTAAQGERSCRSINVILITAGDEGCDNYGPTPVGVAQLAAAQLHAGFTVGGITWIPKVYVINFSQGGLSSVWTDVIAQAGGTGASYVANNETQLAQAFSNIISSSVGPEVCDNGDNNCNGCTDEGYTHYCNQGQTCCAWATDPQRLACIQSYTQSITPANPGGTLSLLPCTTPVNQADPLHWLCYDPKETCDSVDNNCQNGVDENTLKCGNPSHCPSMEICDATDNDCDGQTDEGAVCNNQCLVAPTPEICDGCDNDCDGIVDEGIAPVSCGVPTPQNCAGTAVCTLSGQAVGQPGACLPGGGFGACSNGPLPEVCDGSDNNCNGVIDDGIPAVACVPAGQPGNLNYGVNSQCKQGTQKCGGQCIGFVGPSTEVCDGIDNDCDGQVDESPFGVGQPCGFNAPPCTPGSTVCVNGSIVCQGGVNPQSEVCDGIDNDCDGTVDEVPLSDAPAAGQNGCWNLPGGGCVFQSLGWNPPAGATCTGNGNLSAPCNHGTLACAGAQGWTCVGSNVPAAETCDGIDNDCNGSVDDGNLPQVGQICGTDVGECDPGTVQCAAGVLDCVGDVSPTPEVCNGLDDDCDGVIDNGVAGAICDPIYDASVYPGDRSHLPCKQGVTQCTQDGQSICVGSVGPSPEVCNGIDDDCDGDIDETAGVGPDSIAGTANPNPPPAVNIGDPCGLTEGVCEPGTYLCVSGSVVCQGQTDPSPEECDCLDNDCNGVQDNVNADGTPLCSAGKECVQSAFGCQCAQKCDGEVQPCPGGQTCVPVNMSETGLPLGNYCVVDPCPNNCFNAKVTDAAGKTVCGPAGTPSEEGCLPIPQCACADAAGCQAPCYGVTCDNNQACTNYGANAGTCVDVNCFNFPCEDCNEVCGPQGQCLPNPCKPESCPGQTCKPSDDYMTAICVPSCADVECPAGQVCVDGACADDCDPCADGTVCDHGTDPATCVDDACDPDNPCTNGAYCDPLTGTCGPDPCAGVLCPGTQVCFEGDCFLETPTSSVSTTTGAGGGGTSTSVGSGGGAAPRGVWGLATGGGGCACEAAGSERGNSGGGALAALGLALVALRRRNKRNASAAQEVL